MYKRILILGTGGSGKTTLGKKIGKIISAESKSVDDLRYSNDFNHRFSDKKQDNNLKRLLGKNKWVLDGVYNETYITSALKKADLIIVLKSSRLKLVYQIMKRELAKINRKNKPLFSLLKILYWSQKFKRHNEAKPLQLAEKFKKKLIFLENNSQKKDFINALIKT